MNKYQTSNKKTLINCSSNNIKNVSSYQNSSCLFLECFIVENIKNKQNTKKNNLIYSINQKINTIYKSNSHKIHKFFIITCLIIGWSPILIKEWNINFLKINDFFLQKGNFLESKRIFIDSNFESEKEFTEIAKNTVNTIKTEEITPIEEVPKEISQEFSYWSIPGFRFLVLSWVWVFGIVSPDIINFLEFHWNMWNLRDEY